MKPLIPLLLAAVAAVFSPLVSTAQTPAPTFTDAQLIEGIKSGLGLMVTQTVVQDSLKPGSPTLLAKASEELTKANKADTVKRYDAAMADVVRRLTPQVADALRNSLKNMKVEDPKALLGGSSRALTQAWQQSSRSAVREAFLPAVRKEITSADLKGKAKAMLDAAYPAGVKGATTAVENLDYHLRDRLTDEAFKLLATKEAQVRANPDLLKGNALAQKIFAAYKK